jgi:flavin reductase (DIM6/NTAB) family NADH-FMN oxidoreductase RutF
MHRMLSQDREILGGALGRLPSGLYIVTAGNGPMAQGMLASWVQQCGFEPPSVSVAVGRDRGLGPLLVPGAKFAIHVIRDGQKDLLRHFGKGAPPGPEGFAPLAVRLSDDLPPLLEDAHAHLLCEVSGRFQVGDHDLVTGTVLAGRSDAEGEPWTHVRRNGFRY